MNVLNKKIIAEKVAESHNMTKKEALEIVDLVFDSITDSLKNNERVDITNFGKFEVKNRAGHVGINPQTKEKIEISSSKLPTFRASKVLKESIK